MKRVVGLWVLCLATALSGHSQVDTSFIYNTQMPYGTLDLRIAKSSTRYYYLQEGITFSYRESAPGVKTNTYVRMTTWNTSAYGEGNLREVNGSSDNFVMNYRLLKPKNYNDNYSPGYPIIIMFHGGGEAANCWIDERCHWASARWNPITNSPQAPTDASHQLLNNDRNLLHGGAQHLTAVNLAGSKLPDDPSLPDKAFPGFVLFPQSLNGWGPSATVEDAIRILRLLIKKYNIDENRIYVHGLSNGGGGVYQALKRAPWLFAAALPMSAVNDGGINSQGMVDEVAKLPLWVFQGGQDINPTPQRTYNYIRSFRKAGATVRYDLYPSLGHGTWNTAYREPDFFSWMLEKKKNNPHVYFGVPTICNTTQVGVKMGFSKGFFAYEWQRNGQTIADATGAAEYTANIPGTYRGRFSRKPNPGPNDWEPWSDPVVVSEMNPEKPLVATLGTAHLRGPGLPSTDENNSVKLRAVEEAELYVWMKNGSEINFSGTDIDDTLRTATIMHAFTGANGSYTLVTYNNNCPSPPSEPVSLFFNNSSPQNISLAAEALNFRGTVTSSSIFLSWNDVSSVETGYELWRRREGTPHFQFVTKTSANAVSFHDDKLDPGTTYEYKLRAVNNSGRSNYVPSDDVNVNYKFTTRGDFHFPPPPQNLQLVDNTLNTITLSWEAARDESSVKTYWVYHGNDSINTGNNSTTYTITGLPPNSVYPISVRAVDFGNHLSQPSNQIIATTYLTGLIYKHSTGAWENLDDSSMVATWTTPEFTGTVNNFTLQPRTQDDYFNFQFTGYLNIEVEGTYYFNVSSDDGSRLILDGNVVVDNNGRHGTRTVASDAIYLTAGPHAIEVQYFDDVAGHNLTVRYKGPGVGDGVNFVPIPDSALRSGTYIPPAPPSAPTGVAANSGGMEIIEISWLYADDGTTDYEVYRATSGSGPFTIIARATGTSAVDTIGLIPGTTYYYKVKTVRDNGTSGFSSVASATTSTDNVPPTVPQNLELITKTVSNLAFSWNPSTDNVGVVEYEVFSGSDLIGTSSIQAFTAENLEPNTQYVFTVRAVDASGNRSGASAELTVITNVSAMFYSMASGNLSDLTTWRRNADGTGDSPTNFSDNGQYFVISNRTATSIGGDAWDVGGGASRVIIPAGVTFTAEQPFTANVELQGDAVLNLNHATAPNLVRMSAQSTVNFGAAPVIPAKTYGNVILSGTDVKTFDPGTTTILGNLTVSEGLPLKGAPHNNSVIVLSGILSLNGSRPVTAADNTIDLELNGAAPQTITTNSDVHLYRITVSSNHVVNVTNPSAERIAIVLGSLNGGGLVLLDGSRLNVNEHHVVMQHAAVVNPDLQTGMMAVNGGDFSLSSTSGKNSNLFFAVDNNTINRFTVNLSGAGQAIVRSILQISDGIKIASGKLASEGNIALLASPEKTAVIYEIENAGQITGNVTVQQYLSASGDVFWYLSSPVSGVNVADWQQSFPITGQFTGSSPGGPAPSLFHYREGNGGWVAHPPAGGSNTVSIEKGVGYAARISSTPLTVSVNGNPYQGNASFSLPAIGSDPQSNGWNLVGNPYASPIVWSTAEGAWARSGVNNVIAMRKNSVVGGQMRSQVIYYDIMLGGIIPQGEAFWVKTYAASPSLTVHEKAKVNPDVQNPPMEDVKYMIVNLKQGDVSDPAYIRFTIEGTDGLDPALDGRKLSNYGMFNLSTVTADTISLAVNNVSSDFCSKTIRLNIQNVAAGSYSFSFTNVGLAEIGEIILTDHFAGTSSIITGSDYTFAITEDPASFGRSRFEITFNKDQLDLTSPQIAATDVCAPGPGYVTVSASQEGALYQAVNANGEVISELIPGTGETIEIEIPAAELVAGANMIQVTAGFLGCDRQTFASDLTLNYLSQLTVTTDADVSICEGADVTLEASGAPPSGFYKWFDETGTLIEGQTGSTLLVTEVLSESVYYVSSALQDGCESELAEIHIYPDTLDLPVILVREDTLYTDVVGFYQWKKDGEDIPGATLNYYVPTADGKYSVVASNGGCVKESEPYQIGEPVDETPVTGIEDVNNPEFVLNVFPIPTRGNAINILLRSPKTGPVLVEIIDAMGRLYYSKHIDVHTLTQGTDLVPMSPLYNGIYFLRLTQEDIRARKKIVVKN